VNPDRNKAHSRGATTEAGPARPAASGRGRWLTEPLEGLFDASLQHRVLDIVSLTAAAALIGEFLYILYADKPVGAVMQAAFWLGLVGFLSVPVVVRLTRSVALGALIVLVALGGLIVVPAYYQGGASALFTVWFLLIPLLAGLLLGHRIAIVMGLFGVGIMTGLFALEIMGRLPDAAEGMDPVPAWLNLVSAIAFSAAVGAIFAKTLVASADRLKAAKIADAAKARALEEAIEGIARVGSDGRFRTVNSALASMHACKPGELIGTPADTWIVEEDRRGIEVAVAALAESGRQELTVLGQRRDGTSFVENVFLIAIPNEPPGEHYRFARDVTRQRELTEQLTQSVKMDAIGRLAGGIAHDFNNLLMTILTASDRLKKPVEGLPEPNQGPKYLGWINTAAQRGASLTRQLLDFSHVKASDPGPIDVNQSLRRLIGMLGSVLGTTIRVESELHGEPLVTVGDLARFESGLMNLAVNARDAMPEGGSLCFRSKELNLDPTDPRFAAFHLETDRFVCIEVTDDGAGIASEILDDIFDPFFTTKPVGKGTGLGLSLFYTYTREVGGAMEIHSQAGEGTTVSIYLPRSDQLPFATEESGGAGATGDETVLLAEDEPLVAELLDVVLTEAGFQVISCADGREAVENFHKYRDSIAVVLLDYRMPELNGIEAFKLIRGAAPQTPVILMSGNIAGAEIRDLERSGIRSVLRKPCSGNDVLEAVRSAIDLRH
jgi:PAS domain S-box-containing protein